MTNIDSLGRTANMNRFKIMNMMWKTQYTSKSDLKEDVEECYELAGSEIPVSLMYIYKSVDLIKLNNPFNLPAQINEFKSHRYFHKFLTFTKTFLWLPF